MNERAAMEHLLTPEPPADATVEAKLSGTPGVAVKGLFLLALLYTCYFARSLLLPVVLAILLSLILYPAVRWLKRAFIPEPLGAAFIVVSLAAFLGTGLYQLFEPASDWIAKMPRITEQIERKLWSLRKSMEEVSKAAAKVEALATVEGPAKPRTAEVVTRPPSLMSRVVANTQDLLVAAAATLVLLFFLLASGDLFMRKIVRMLPTLTDKKKAVALARTIQTAMARYLFTITCINVGLGLATALMLHFLKMPNALLWGVMVALLNYIPYIGPAVSGAILTIVAFITFDDLGEILLVPLCYFALETFEGQFVTPLLTGRSLTLNPVMIFLSMLLWGWMWGVVGALIAVPILMTLKIFCDHIESLNAIGEFMGAKVAGPDPATDQA
ncbi:MAG TPA: AI-2E family transporter [Burkholderiales bacterium]|nr:AI-2E family transporter [Burkholderiales bacterium]